MHNRRYVGTHGGVYVCDTMYTCVYTRARVCVCVTYSTVAGTVLTSIYVLLTIVTCHYACTLV